MRPIKSDKGSPIRGRLQVPFVQVVDGVDGWSVKRVICIHIRCCLGAPGSSSPPSVFPAPAPVPLCPREASHSLMYVPIDHSTHSTESRLSWLVDSSVCGILVSTPNRPPFVVQPSTRSPVSHYLAPYFGIKIPTGCSVLLLQRNSLDKERKSLAHVLPETSSPLPSVYNIWHFSRSVLRYIEFLLLCDRSHIINATLCGDEKKFIRRSVISPWKSS